MAYCPNCLCNTLSISPNGVVHVMVNNKALQANQFLYNINKDTKEELNKKVEDKIDEFLKWYSGFQNRDPVKEITLSSSDFVCTNNCKTKVGSKFSVINLLISSHDLLAIAKKLTEKHGLKLEITSFENIDI